MHYLPSVIAGATMIYVIREIEPCNAMEYQNQLMSVLRISKVSFLLFESIHNSEDFQFVF